MSNRWFFVAAAIVFAAVVGVIAYNTGLHHGVMESGRITVAAPGTVPYPYPYPYYGWHGGFFILPFFFILFVFFLVRGLFWRGAWHRGGGPCGYRHEAFDAFDEAHRRAHERMSNVSV